MKRSIFVAAVGTVGAFASALFAQQFTYSAASLPAQNVWTNGVELVDVDGDGDRDVLFANGSSYSAGGAQPQHLFLNNGSGTFSAAHANLNVANFNAQMVIAEDFDNDGDKDLMYAPEGAYPATTQAPRMLINNGSGIFSDESATRIPAITIASFCVCAGDVDDDGDLDVVFTNGATFGGVAAQALLYLNNGSGFFTNATATNCPVDTYNAQDVTLGDWDADFDVDIIQTGKGGTGKRSRLWLNDGSGVFTTSTIIDASGTNNTYEGDPADLDGDGDLDIAMQSISGFAEGWVRNNGATVTNTTFGGTNSHDDNEMAAMDYDMDGDLDVLVGSLSGPGEKAYQNTANVFTYDATVFQAQTDSTLDFGFADLNGDRTYDMVTAQGESGNFTDKVYFNNGPVDSLPPTIQATVDPGAIGGSGTVFRIRVRDQVADDGHVSANARLLYGNVGGTTTAGAARAVNQGCGTFRGVATSSVGTTAVSAAWVIVDEAGNATGTPTQQFGAGANGWASPTPGLAGSHGVPLLVGVGVNEAGTVGYLGLYGARPNSLAVLFIGSAGGNVPYLGGTLLPFPVISIATLNTDAAGELAFGYVFPAGITAGTNIYLQYAIEDSVAVQGAALSNGVVLTAQ